MIYIGGTVVLAGAGFLAYMGVCNCLKFEMVEFKKRTIVFT
jgi:hypothetical protein